jgi:hypothetical protein
MGMLEYDRDQEAKLLKALILGKILLVISPVQKEVFCYKDDECYRFQQVQAMYGVCLLNSRKASIKIKQLKIELRRYVFCSALTTA